jgi:class 3 adenylate cyclase
MPLGFAGAPLVRKLRLAAGLTLFTYVLLHLTNHSLGLVSYQAMEAGLGWALVLWRSLPGTVALYGVMALFGVEKGGDAGCRQALLAAGAMVERVLELSEALGEELSAPLRIGVGVHVGTTVVGGMGYGRAFYLTAVGDTVHVAARLEALTKEYGCELVISEDVAVGARADVAGLPRHELTLRNRQTPLTIVVVPSARALADRLVGAGDTVGAGS